MKRRNFIRTLLVGATAAALCGGIEEDVKQEERVEEGLFRHGPLTMQPMRPPPSLVFIYESSLTGEQKSKYMKTEKGKAARARKNKRYRECYPEKVAARSIVGNAARAGKIIRGPCEVCNATPEEKTIEGHHDDYSKPLEVRWLCTIHHHEHHDVSRLDREET